MRREVGQYNGGDGDAEHTQRQLRQAIGIVQPGDAAGRQEGGQHGIQQQVYLAHGHPEQGRHHQLQDTAHARVPGIPDGPGQQVQAVQRGQLEQQLDNAGEKHPPGQGKDRFSKPGGRHRGGKNQRQVEKNRGKRRYREAAIAVEYGPTEPGHGNQQQVGERDTDHLRGEQELFALADEAGSKQRGDQRRSEHTQGSDQ